MKVAIIGANGQVGSEVCLLLRNHPEITLVPIARHSGASVSLRYHGVACRHGLPADSAQGHGLFSDCELIANFALGSGTPAEAARQNKLIIENSIANARAGATVIYFSTLAVYGDPRPEALVRWRSSYARQKLRAERYAIEAGKRFNIPVYVLRLGQVCGETQNITLQIRGDIAAGASIGAAAGRMSNTTHTVAIADAILKIAQGAIGPPGTYDLVNLPQWTWQEVYTFEAKSIGKSFPDASVSGSEANRRLGPPRLRGLIRTAFGFVTSTPAIREFALRLAVWLPVSINNRLHVQHLRTRAAREIAQLGPPQPMSEALNWRDIPVRRLEGMTQTRDLLGCGVFHLHEAESSERWPPNLPMAAVS